MSALPGWVEQLRQSYLAGGSSMYILHGNVTDVICNTDGNETTVQPIPEYLAQRLFASYDIVLHYDVGRGLRAFAGADPRRLTQMNALLSRLMGEGELPRDVTQSLRTVDRLISLLLVRGDDRMLKTAILFDYADLICPADERGGENLAIFLNWARSPIIRRVNLIFLLLTEGLSRLHSALVQSGYTQEVPVPLPDEGARRQLLTGVFKQTDAESSRLAKMTAGLTLANLDRMMRVLGPAPPTPADAGDAAVKPAPDAPAKTVVRGSDSRLAAIKKELMEAQVPGLLEFVEPKYDLGMVAGHTVAKERLANDARLVSEGNLEAVPMGYLLCGPVGVGKTFLALCYAGSVGIPCVTIRNFRSKYVGETEANLERILGVVRELGPVAVIIDEADAAVGNRGATGDSGTSARVFAQLASQMGDTRYRGKIIWFMLTCRPDLLPIDLKRQGRCEEHIPLFYPQNEGELREMFLAMARKAKIDLTAETLPDLGNVSALSGADIESVLTRARREALLRGVQVDAALLKEVLDTFRSIRGSAHELQVVAAIMESSDLRYLPEKIREQLERPGGYDALARKFAQLSALEGAPQGE